MLCGLLEIIYTGRSINSPQNSEICAHQRSVARRYSTKEPLSNLTRNLRGLVAIFRRLSLKYSPQTVFRRSISSRGRLSICDMSFNSVSLNGSDESKRDIKLEFRCNNRWILFHSI